MALALIVAGLAGVLVGTHNLVRRGAIVARYQRRGRSALVQSPSAYAISGGIGALAGTLMMLAGVLQLA